MISDELTPNNIQSLAYELGLEMKIKNSSTWITCWSPLREENQPSFGFNVKSGAWKDHGTGETGDLVTLVEKLRGIDNKEAVKWIADKADISGALYKPLTNGYSKPKKKDPKPDFWNKQRLQFIKDGIKRLKNESGHELIKKVKDYDCLKVETLQKFGCGIVEQWGSDWLAFPYGTGCQLYKRDEEKNIRSVKESSPGESFFGIKQTTGKDTLFISKSPRETMLLYQEYGDHADVVGLCTGEQGSLSKEQLSALSGQISASKYSNIYVFLDCDTETAYNTAKELTNEVDRIAENQNLNLVNIHAATNGAYKDVTDCFRDGMDTESFQALLENAESIKNTTTEDDTFDQQFDISTAPPIPGDVYENLPKTLQTRCNLIEQAHRRDVFLVSALPVLAAHMPNVKAAHADGYYTPDLSTQVVSGPGAGKGTATKAKRMGNTLHLKLMEESRQEIAEYNSLPDEAKATLNEPMERSLFIPANSSSRAIYDVLQANGGWGLLFETEIDTMLNATGQEWGNFSDITRKAFHHEAISINRKGEKFFIDEPRLSICITGTFDQFKKMFESAENGHFSRYALYTFQVQRTWESHRPTKASRALDESILTASDSLYEMYKILNRRTEPLYIDLHPEQWQMIDDTFADKMQIIEDLELSSYLHASNNRAAVLALRMASMFTVLRTFENEPDILESDSFLSPTQEDMTAALWLADTFIKHAFRLYNILPKATDTNSKGERYKQFIVALPNEFQTAEAIEIADKLDIPEPTVKRWLSNMNEVKKIKHGHYAKVS